MKRIIALILALILAAVCGCTAQPDASGERTTAASGYADTVVLYRFDGYGVGTKNIDGILAHDIIGAVSSLEKTGGTQPEIEGEFHLDMATYISVDHRFMIWLDCGSAGLYRVNPDRTEICMVQSYLGKGETLKMTDELGSLIRDAWYYYPNDVWSGTYRNGAVTLRRVYEMDSAVADVKIDEVRLGKDHNEVGSITLTLTGRMDKDVEVTLFSRQSDDNLGLGDHAEVFLKKGGETTVTLDFSGFDVQFYLAVTVDNTRIDLTVVP